MFSCVSSRSRIYFATPKADSSVYYEYSLHDVLSDNITGEDAYKQDASSFFKYFHIVSEVYILYDDNQHIILSDSSENSIRVTNSDNLYRKYKFDRNGDYDANKIYRVKYTLCWNDLTSTYRTEHLSIEIDSIEGLLTYSEYEQLKREQERLQRKNAVESAYQSALNAPGIDALIQYIKTYNRWYLELESYEDDYDEYLNEDAYAEIARRLTDNPNIDFHKLGSVQNPYAFKRNAVYFCELYVVQWMNQSILAAIGSRRGYEYQIIINKVPNIFDIKEVIQGAFLIYTGTTEIEYTNGAKKMIPCFELIYQFDENVHPTCEFLLCQGVLQNDITMVRIAIDEGVDVNDLRLKKQEALTIVNELLYWFMKVDDSITEKDIELWYEELQIYGGGDLDDLDFSDIDSPGILGIAVMNDNVEIADILIKSGALIDVDPKKILNDDTITLSEPMRKLLMKATRTQ
jgi:hypothetical protein